MIYLWKLYLICWYRDHLHNRARQASSLMNWRTGGQCKTVIDLDMRRPSSTHCALLMVIIIIELYKHRPSSVRQGKKCECEQTGQKVK